MPLNLAWQTDTCRKNQRQRRIHPSVWSGRRLTKTRNKHKKQTEASIVLSLPILASHTISSIGLYLSCLGFLKNQSVSFDLAPEISIFNCVPFLYPASLSANIPLPSRYSYVILRKIPVAPAILSRHTAKQRFLLTSQNRNPQPLCTGPAHVLV